MSICYHKNSGVPEIHVNFDIGCDNLFQIELLFQIEKQVKVNQLTAGPWSSHIELVSMI
jgi:hypothetical protein